MNPHLILMVLVVSILGLSGLFLYLLPGLTRPDIYFAVTVQPDFRETPDGRDIQARYQREIVISTLIAIALLVGAVQFNLRVALILAPFLLVVGSVIAFLRARQQVMPHAISPSPVREADLAPVPTRLPGGWLVQSAPFAALLATGIWLHLHWEEIPPVYPVHWGLNGQVNGWARRTPLAVYAPLVMGAAICAGLLLLNYGIAAFSRRIHARGAAGETELRFRNTMLWLMTGVELFLALLMSWVGLLALRNRQEGPNVVVVLLGSVGLVAVVIFVFIHFGQGGTRLAESSSQAVLSVTEASPVGDRSLDRYWKAGMFYVNSDDPALIVEKRFGIGYTMNFGHPLSWVILLLLVVGPLVFALLMAHLK
jgi:uncharacterized membrane protein